MEVLSLDSYTQLLSLDEPNSVADPRILSRLSNPNNDLLKIIKKRGVIKTLDLLFSYQDRWEKVFRESDDPYEMMRAWSNFQSSHLTTIALTEICLPFPN